MDSVYIATYSNVKNKEYYILGVYNSVDIAVKDVREYLEDIYCQDYVQKIVHNLQKYNVFYDGYGIETIMVNNHYIEKASEFIYISSYANTDNGDYYIVSTSTDMDKALEVTNEYLEDKFGKDVAQKILVGLNKYGFYNDGGSEIFTLVEQDILS